jgi:hypothetical protein
MHDLIHSWGNNLFSFQFVADFLCNAQSLGAADAPHQMQMTSISAWRKHESASPFFLISKTPVSNPTSAKLQTGTVVWQTNPSIKRAFREHHPDAISSLCNNGSRISSCWRGGEKKGAKKNCSMRFTLITFWCALFSVVQKIMTDKMCKERNPSSWNTASLSSLQSPLSFTLQQAKAPWKKKKQ